MTNITREQLGNILSTEIATRTLHNSASDGHLDINGDWIVRYISTDNKGVLEIYCEPTGRCEE